MNSLKRLISFFLELWNNYSLLYKLLLVASIIMFIPLLLLIFVPQKPNLVAVMELIMGSWIYAMCPLYSLLVLFNRKRAGVIQFLIRFLIGETLIMLCISVKTSISYSIECQSLLSLYCFAYVMGDIILRLVMKRKHRDKQNDAIGFFTICAICLIMVASVCLTYKSFVVVPYLDDNAIKVDEQLQTLEHQYEEDRNFELSDSKYAVPKPDDRAYAINIGDNNPYHILEHIVQSYIRLNDIINRETPFDIDVPVLNNIQSEAYKSFIFHHKDLNYRYEIPYIFTENDINYICHPFGLHFYTDETTDYKDSYFKPDGGTLTYFNIKRFLHTDKDLMLILPQKKVFENYSDFVVSGHLKHSVQQIWEPAYEQISFVINTRKYSVPDNFLDIFMKDYGSKYKNMSLVQYHGLMPYNDLKGIKAINMHFSLHGQPYNVIIVMVNGYLLINNNIDTETDIYNNMKVVSSILKSWTHVIIPDDVFWQ